MAGGLDELDDDVAGIAAAEVDASIRWLWDHSTSDPDVPGFGQVLDRDDLPGVTSTAATGFALAAWCVGIERGLLAEADVVARVRGALRGLLRLPERGGLMVHFADAVTLVRQGRAEYSTIDTTLALDGAVVAAQILDDAEITSLTDQLLTRVDWRGAVHERDGRTLLHMARVDSEQDDYGAGAGPDGWVGAWDMTAEQLTMYVLAAGHPDVDGDLARALWTGFDRPVGTFRGHTCVHEPGGTLFVYHFPHAFWPFGLDPQGTDWWHNAREASLANAAWCASRSAEFPTFAAGLWGTAAGLGPWGYVVNGAEPARPPAPRCDGTIPPASLLGALPLCPTRAGAALRVLREEYPQTWDERYGFADGINLGAGESGASGGSGAGQPHDLPEQERGRAPGAWFAPARFGLNKGVSALLGAAALGSTLVWDAYAAHPWTARGIETLGLRRGV